MPAIRLVKNYGTPNQEEVWRQIFNVKIDKDGYLELFSLDYYDPDTKEDWQEHYHLLRHDVSFADAAVSIWASMTSLRSAKGLMQGFNDIAGKTKWKSASGIAGVTIGSAAVLAEFLKNRPFSKEGYYNTKGDLFLPRKIKTSNKNDYDSRQSDKDPRV